MAERQLELVEMADPPPPAADEVQVRVRAVALNHIDLWGFRGMAFAKRTLPLTVGVEAVGEVAAVGADVRTHRPGDRVALYGGRTCGVCQACRQGRDNLCADVTGIAGFHVDGFARTACNLPARLCVAIPDGLSWTDAACAPLTFATVEHMLFDNARLMAGEWILIHAAGSGIGSAAIRLAKDQGATVIATAGDDAKLEKALALGADHVVNYRTQRFESMARRLTGKRGVDVVFEHVGPDTWSGSLLALCRGGRLVTCGSTGGILAETNLFQVFQQQLRIFGSFGATRRNVRDVLARMASGRVAAVIDSVIPLDRWSEGLTRLEERRVFGKIVVTMP
ncbi:zinc-binding dehydrogenase [Allostella humosa]|nr:zinc-binding dehydrogenase [Stella humosa]